MIFSGLPVVVCNHREFAELFQRSLNHGKEGQKPIDDLRNRTRTEILEKLTDLINQEEAKSPVYILLPGFYNRKGMILRLWRKNNFHWEVVAKELSKDEAEQLSPHWYDGYELGPDCLCDKNNR